MATNATDATDAMGTRADIALRDAFVPLLAVEQAHLQGLPDGRVLETPVEPSHRVRGTAGGTGTCYSGEIPAWLMTLLHLARSV